LNGDSERAARHRGWGKVDQQTIEYFRRRELAERSAAKRASCEIARRVHEELAQHYAELLRSR